MTLQIPFTSNELYWHLQNNVQPSLSKPTIDKVVEICNLVNMGEMCLDDEISEGTGIYVCDMLNDLHIDYND